jgi:MoaA/NifB/PqqE/SkfB family radical SAM enzyme
MARMPLSNVLGLFLRGSANYAAGRPLVVSFELTASCNARCGHCDKGGMVKGERPLSPERIGAIYRELSPVAVQLSGGEPLLRRDVVEVARAVKEPWGAPYLILVTNGALLTAERYEALRAAGVNQFSISLDFPDDRHDDFRRVPGLFRRLARAVPELTGRGHGDVVLNTAISRLNAGELTRLRDVARAWGAAISFSAYSALRTGNTDLLVSSPEDLRLLRAQLDAVARDACGCGDVKNPLADLEGIYRFFAEGGAPGCRAGHRFLLVTPDGDFRPCAHKPVRARSQRELVERFSRTNDCRGCYVAIRSYCDKGYLQLLREQVLTRLGVAAPAAAR